jgi:hypothetical protein
MEHFSDHCATCHSNDGEGPDVFRQGPLSETARHACSRDAGQSDGELISTSKVSLPTAATYLSFLVLSTWTQLLAVSATGLRIQSVGSLISGFSGGT